MELPPPNEVIKLVAAYLSHKTIHADPTPGQILPRFYARWYAAADLAFPQSIYMAI
jgi:hypothetical protein